MSIASSKQKSDISSTALLQAVSVPTTADGLREILREAMPRAPEHGHVFRAIDRGGRKDLPAIVGHLQHDADRFVGATRGQCRQRTAEIVERVEHRLPGAVQHTIRTVGLVTACAALESATAVLRDMVTPAAAAAEEARVSAQEAFGTLRDRQREFDDAKPWRFVWGILPLPPSRRRLRRAARGIVEAASAWNGARLDQEVAGAAYDLSVTLADHFQRRATLHAGQHGMVASAATPAPTVDNDEEILSAISEMQPSREWAERIGGELVAARTDELRSAAAERLAVGDDAIKVIDDLTERILADVPLPANASQFLTEIEPNLQAALARRERLADQQALREPFAQAGLKRREARLLEAPDVSNGGPLVEAFRNINPNGAFTLEADSSDPREIRIYTEERGLAVNAFKSFKIARAIVRTLRPADLLPMLTVIDDPRELLALNPDEDPMSEFALLALGETCSRSGDNSYWLKIRQAGASVRVARGLSDMLEKIASRDEAVVTALALAREDVRRAGHVVLRQRVAAILNRSTDFVPAAGVGRFREALRLVSGHILIDNDSQDNGSGPFQFGRSARGDGFTPASGKPRRQGTRQTRDGDYAVRDGNGSDGRDRVGDTCDGHDMQSVSRITKHTGHTGNGRRASRASSDASVEAPSRL